MTSEYGELVKRLKDRAGLLRRMDEVTKPRQVTTATQNALQEAAQAIERLIRKRDELDAVVEQRNVECSRNFKELAEARVEIERKDRALEAIQDHKPDAVTEKIDHDVENCADCKRMEGHPISHGRCNEWYHQHYRIKDKQVNADNREQFQMRRIAREALTTPASGKDSEGKQEHD